MARDNNRRPDRFHRDACIPESLSTHATRLTKALMKPVRSASIRVFVTPFVDGISVENKGGKHGS
ncbi:MAG: hypothetical protein Q7T89_08595 [Anaerolineales bacterium]|nr:hypothetical protein [Anaerolineales bacterium]